MTLSRAAPGFTLSLRAMRPLCGPATGIFACTSTVQTNTLRLTERNSSARPPICTSGTIPPNGVTRSPTTAACRCKGFIRESTWLYYGNGGELEYDLTVKAGADPRRIRFHLQGDDASLDQHGDLVSELIQKHPVAYQISADGSRRTVDSRYRKNADGSYGFAARYI